MNQYMDFKLLDDSLLSLAGKDDSQRAKAAAAIKVHVEHAARELSLERFARFENELYQNILSYVNGSTISEKTGGILAIRELIDCTSASAEMKVTKFAKALSNALGTSTDFGLIELIADALGHMARNSPVSDVDYLEAELARSLEWLKNSKSSSTHRKFAACVVLRQLAHNAPTIFFARVNEFFDLIWVPIWDHKEGIRQVAGGALSACLAVLKERTFYLQWYCQIYDMLQEGLQNGGEEFVHGSLLVVGEVLKYTGDFMLPRFKEVSRAIMQLKDHKSKIVRAEIITLLPSLANLCPDAFARAHMDESVDFLLKCSKVNELRPQALIATGKLCLAMGTHLVSRIDELMNIIREAFLSNKRGSKNNDVAEALLCISDMVQGLGAPFHSRIIGLFELMLQSGLTSELIDTLAVISTFMPGQRTLVQTRLLEEATKVLGGTSEAKLVEPEYCYSWGKQGERRRRTEAKSGGLTLEVLETGSHLLQPVASRAMLPTSPSTSTFSTQRIGGARGNARPGSSRISRSVVSPPPTPQKAVVKAKKSFSFMHTFTKHHSNNKTSVAGAGMGVAAMGFGLGLGSEKDPTQTHQPNNDIVLLSLRTLASLTIPSFTLIHIVQNSVIPYFHSDDYLVRKEAAVTCAKMVAPILAMVPKKGPTALAMEDIVKRLLEVAVSDTSSVVRQGALKSLTSEFDGHLCRAHHIDTLMLLLADELFDIKIEALNILGRLAVMNAAAVLPPIRIHLTRLISELQNSPDHRLVEEASSMLCNFMKFNRFHFLVKPVMRAMLDALPLRRDVRATTAALETIGELSDVLQHELANYADTLLPVVISNMFDASSLNKQEVAVRTLGRFCKSTGLVVRPYYQFPQLLPKTLDLLCRNRASKPLTLRMEILRTLGLLGALEPSRFSAIVQFIQNCVKNKRANDECEERVERRGQPVVSFHVSETVPDKGSYRPGAGESPTRERDRTESNISVDKGSLYSKYENDGYRHMDRRAGSGLEQEEIIYSEKLLQGDNGDAPSYLFMYEQSVMRAIPDPPTDKMFSSKLTPSSADFFPKVALAALVKVLQDPSLNVLHSSATNTIIHIFNGLGVKCIPFLEQIVPYFLQIVRKSAGGLRESVLQQLAQLVAIIGPYVAPYLPAIFDILRDYWSDHLEFVLAIVQQIAITSADTFAAFLPTLLPLLLSSLTLPRDLTYSSFRAGHSALKPLEEMLSCIRALRVALRAHIHLFVPPLCKLISQLQDFSIETLPTQTSLLQTLRYLLHRTQGAVAEQSHAILSSVVHTVCRSLIKLSTFHLPPNAEIYLESGLIFSSLAQQVGQRILKFDNLILRAAEHSGLDCRAYKEIVYTLRGGMWDEHNYADQDSASPLVAREHMYEESGLVGIRNGRLSPDDDDRMHASHFNTSPPQSPLAGAQKLALNQQQLARSWDVSQRSTANDWYEWLWRFNVELLRESPSPALRACASLAQTHPPMARELFHAAFVSCWLDLTDQYQENLVKALQAAFRSTTIPPDILQHLLNLAEFMERDVQALPISLSILADLAQKGHAYAKALHYREQEYKTNPAGCFENLININKKLEQYDAASGLLKVAVQIQRKYPELKAFYTVQESWLAKLGYWEEALEKYEEKLQHTPRDSVAIAGKMKCLEALGRWEEAVKLCEEHLDVMRVECEMNGTNTHTKAAVIGARAAWSLNEWSLMDNFVNQLPTSNVDSCFLKAVLSVHQQNYDESRKLIAETRDHLDKSISSLMAESYGRAYMALVMAQQCSELEEITEYKLFLKEHGLSDVSAPVVDFSTPSLHNEQMEEYLHCYGPPRKPNRHGSLSSFLEIHDAIESVEESSSSNTQGLLHEASRRKAQLSEKWRRRIRGCCSSGRAAIPFWKYLLNGRRMVLSEREDLDTWLEFVSLCRNGGNPALAERVLMISEHSALNSINSTVTGSSALQPPDVVRRISPLSEEETMVMERRIKFAMLKQQWAVGNRSRALLGLESLVRNTRLTASNRATDSSYLSCILKLGEWKIAILDPGVPVDIDTRLEVLGLFSRATMVDTNSYKAWHQWGLSNYRAIEEVRSRDGQRKSTGRSGGGKTMSSLSKEQIVSLAVNAIKGFTRALVLGLRKFSSSVMQDMLCILSLWFRYGKVAEVNATLQSGLSSIPLENWLGVIPQLIARIDHPDQETRLLLHNLLSRIGMKHAQALVYPLSVALKSPQPKRQEAADQLMKSLRQHSTKLIDQALMVSQELVRVAILWEEKWHGALEEASRYYYGDGNVQAMLFTLLPLHEALEAGPTTLREAAFIEAYRHELSSAWECLKTYQRVMEERNLTIPTQKQASVPNTPEHAHLAQAWDFYYAAFRRINAQLPHINSLDLQSCSPQLFASSELDLGVPGTYAVNGTAIRIRSFSPIISIIRSKQRPRKLRMCGEDGQEFAFLLKGNEDLRQDERAMQLFGLVNALMHHDRRTGITGDDLQIQRYAVTPLSQNVGLIGWVPNFDTLHDLIRSHRDSHNVMVDMEHRMILRMAPGKLYDSLPVMHKLEAFENAMMYSDGEDLSKILWLKSENSESWLQRRTTYTRSLAVMSMVGYVLGLGDRHPSNLMLDRKTGKILHIDFGDCFEVAKHREKFPERVPFRLTRMLVNAMEVAKIEGNFRCTCEKVMTVLRENRDSLVAILEAFVHDPLISWRLMNIATKAPQRKAEVKSASPNKSDPNINGEAAVAVAEESGAVASSSQAVGAPRARSKSIGKSFVNSLEPISEHVVTSEDMEADAKEVATIIEGFDVERSEDRQTSPRLLTAKGVAAGPGTFADHSVATDIIATSLARAELAQDPDHLLVAQEMSNARHSSATAAKTVSFSLLNQTIDADNTIRQSSVSVAIVQRSVLDVAEEVESSDNNALPPPPAPPATTAHLIPAAPVEPEPSNYLVTSMRPGLNANLHLEMASLVHSVTTSHTGRTYASSGRHLSLLSTRSYQRLDGTAEDESSQVELTEKAKVVIRRVLDKLTGLDFCKEASEGGNASGLAQHALEVPEQVERLIREATSNENLSQSFFGWCPFW